MWVFWFFYTRFKHVHYITPDRTQFTGLSWALKKKIKNGISKHMSAVGLKAIECKQFTTTINNDAYLPCGCLIWDKKEFFETTYILIVKYMQKET